MEKATKETGAKESKFLKRRFSESNNHQASQPGHVQGVREHNPENESDHNQESVGKQITHFGYKPGDIVIATSDRRFSCHKVVLYEHSQFFKAMFASGMKEAQQVEIPLKHIPSQSFCNLLKFFYTGELDLSAENVEEMAEVCSQLQVTDVLDQCCDLLLTMIEDDLCLSLVRLSDYLMLTEVYNQSRRHALWRFSQVCKTEDFTSAPYAQITDYLQEPYLNIDSEVEVFRAAAVWFLAQGKPWREEDLHEFFGQVVNFHRMTDDKMVLIGDLPEVRGHQALKEFAASLLQKDVLSSLRSKDPTRARTSPRNGSILCMGARQRGPEYDRREWIAAPEVMMFEPKGCSLERVASMFDCYECLDSDPGFRVCSLGHLVYVAGGTSSLGRSGSWLTTMWCLDTQEGTWDEAGTLMNVRRHHGMCAYGKTLYLFGGIGKFRYRLRSTESFNTETEEWQELPLMPNQETSPAVIVHQAKIYVFKNYAQVFNIVTQTWTELTLSTPIVGLPINAYPHPNPDTNSIFVSCFNTESLWLVNLDTHKSELVAKFENEEGRGVLCGRQFYHFQWNGPSTSDIKVECYNVESKSFEHVGVVKSATMSKDLLTMPWFPRYTPSNSKALW